MEYSIAAYGAMIADGIRIEAYVQALESSVKPGDIVLEIGTGTGIMAMVACRLGAGQVIAIERDDVIEIARQIARANQLDNRIKFIQGRSTDVEPSRKADVIVSDLRGVLPLHAGHIEAIVDARTRLLAPGGVLIPKRDLLWAAVVEAPTLYELRVDHWSANGLGFDLSAARELVTNTWWKERIEGSQVLSEAHAVATLDYSTVEDTGVDSSGVVTIHRAGTAHGLSVWFDAELTTGQGFSNAPDKPEAIYGSAFFPLSRPVDVQQGDEVALQLRAIPAGDQYIWAWNSRFERKETELARFRQSTALGIPLTHELLERSLPSFVPTLTRDGAKQKLALELMAGELNIQEIASQLAGRFPGETEDIEYVVRMAQKYSA